MEITFVVGGVTLLLITFVDTVTGEALGYAIKRILEAGASSVHAVPAMTKKGRPSYVVFIEVEGKGKLDNVIKVASRELNTFGLNLIETRHIALKTREEHVYLKVKSGGKVLGKFRLRVRMLLIGDRVVCSHVEYEDLVRVLAELKRRGIELSFMRFKQEVERLIEGRSLKELAFKLDVERASR